MKLKNFDIYIENVLFLNWNFTILIYIIFKELCLFSSADFRVAAGTPFFYE